MYEYIPNPKTKKAKVIGTVLFLSSLALFAASGIPVFAYRGVLQFVSIALLTASILLIGRFAMKAFVYRIDQADGVWELTVDELSRTSRVTVCRLELAKLQKVEVWKKGTKAPKGTRVYNYCVDIAPENTCLLVFSDGAYAPYDKKICIRLQPDDKMTEILSSFVKETDDEL